MKFVDIIEKKKRKQELSEEEITYWISEYCKNNIPDYQVSALLMAITINGMSSKETYYLTKAMTNSGDILDFKDIKGIKVDKHSTGGVGDKTSIALMPLLASCGLKVAKMSGAALGFVGGTVDKLSSIPNMNVFLSPDEISRQVNEIGIAMVGQTANLAPADKKIYALRDVCACVDSTALIVSSIMSKKLACNDDIIELDVKYGRGSFMPTLEDACNLAHEMIQVGKSFNKKICACISSMNQPLGNAVGNALEVKEAIDILLGKGPKDITELILRSGAIILEEAGLYTQIEAAKLLANKIINHEAADLLATMIKYQGGNPKVVYNTSLLPTSKYVTPILANKSGYIKDINAKQIGEMSMDLGAGRERKEDKIDPAVGIVLNKKIGDQVKENEPLSFIHHNKELSQDFISSYLASTIITDSPTEKEPVIAKILYD